MASINGIVFIMIGLFVSAASWKLNFDKLRFFFYIGALFMIYGFAKLAISFIFGKTKEEKIDGREKNLRLNYQRELYQKRQLAGQQRQVNRHQYKKCYKCGNVARIHDNFCSRCGVKLR